QPTPVRRPVSVGGQRVRTVDTHCHCIFQDALSLMGGAGQAIVPPTKGVDEHFLLKGVEGRLRSMDEMGIDMEILSINPFWYRTDRDTGARIVALQNDHLAELCAANPDRFGAFASLTMQFPDLAVKQLEEAMRKPGIRGAAIGGSVVGASFAEPQFRPLLAKAEELGAVLFIHPQAIPEMAARFVGNGWIGNTIGNPLETTIALEHLIFEGVLDRFPKLKILAAHGGGFLPSYAPRIDVSCSVSPQNCNPGIVLKKKPTEYLDQMYYDALVFTPEALRHLVAQVGSSQIVLGTDFPIPWELHPVDMVLATPSLSDAERVAILGGTAAKLFGLTA
ncbi:MAG: amidohydrolase, partial [Pseudomonadota bacterium]|nr:amidohydrolase [Pseudomonadota bacterium]